MQGKFLVAYASKYGATKEIAEKMGEVLRGSGVPADVSPVDQVRGLDAYQAVILGSAVYIGKWQKEAAEFLQDNQQALSERKVWLFSSGPTGEGDPAALVEGWRLPDELKPVAERIQPQEMAVFGGFIDPHKVNFMEKMAIKNIVKKPFGDFRDWDNIVTWAGKVAEAFKTA